MLRGIRPLHWTNMQNTLGYDSTPRIEKKCSGENILGLRGDCCSARMRKTVPYGFFSSITRVSMMSSTLKSLKFCRPMPHS